MELVHVKDSLKELKTFKTQFKPSQIIKRIVIHFKHLISLTIHPSTILIHIKHNRLNKRTTSFCHTQQHVILI